MRVLENVIPKTIDFCYEKYYNRCIFFFSALNRIEKLKTTKHKFDIVFLDPPYHNALVEKALKLLKSNDLLNENAVIVVETDYDENPDTDGFEIIKQAKYGRVLVRILTERK